MAASLISNIYDDFTLAYANGPQSIIDFFTKNTIAFNNLKTFDSDDDLDTYIIMSCHYADALYQKGRYNDTVDIANRALSIIKNEKIELNNSRNDWYYSLLLYKGMACCNLRDYKTAIPIFKKLVTHDPKNERYESWLHNAMLGRRRHVATVIYVASALLIFIDIPLKAFGLASYGFRETLLVIGLLASFGPTAYEYYIKGNPRKS